MSAADRLVVLCRPGFEGDCAAELTERAAIAGAWGHARTRDDAGLLEFFPGGIAPLDLLATDAFAERVFPRQWLAAGPPVDDLPPEDRIGPLLEGWRTPVADALAETADGDEHRSLARLAQRLTGPLRGAFQRANLWVPDEASAPRVHLVLDAGTRAWIGCSPQERSSPSPGGVVRLRTHRDAPSRSALKLEEALSVLLDPTERHLQFAGRQVAVDLGAAPGGWTWVLRREGVEVVAVDNGALAPVLQGDPAVQHVRADAFTWQPLAPPVDWVTCDVVDKPARVVETLARWLRRGWARRALFNLKLPMARRWQAVADARVRFEKVLGERSGEFDLRIRQLYHDREEVTCLALPRSG
jgi:23S rRNA (cytidine2498-2'-O)-methyltransferase